MKKRGLAVWMARVFLFFVFSSMLSFEARADQKAEKITLKMIYQLPWTDSVHVFFKEWQEKVNAAAPNRLYVKYVGAYEAIPTFQQMEALRKGTIDLAVIAPTFYTGLCPEAMAAQCMGAVSTVAKARKAGMVDLQDKIHRAKLGTTILGCLFSGDMHIITLRKRVERGDLTGLKVRAIPVQLPAVVALGGAPISIPAEETYTALQTGVVDGIALPANLIWDYKADEVTSFLFYPFIPMDSFAFLHANAKVWDGLPEDVRKIMMDQVMELEPRVNAHFSAYVKKTESDLLKKGFQKCGATSPEEEQRLLKKIRKAQWNTFVEERADKAWLPQINAIARPVLDIEGN